MDIKKDYDVVAQDVISPEKGYNFTDNDGIKPDVSAIPMTPGEKATNDTAGRDISKGQPFGKGGSGYSNNS